MTATTPQARHEIKYLKRHQAPAHHYAELASLYRQQANNLERLYASDLELRNSGIDPRPDLADPRDPAVQKHRAELVAEMRLTASQILEAMD